MFTPSWTARLLSVVIIPGLFAMPVLGCVRSSTYKAAKKEIQDLQHELQQERLKLQTIEKTYGERMKQMESLVSRLGSSVERYDGIAKNWSDLRNELTMLRVSREMERMKGGSGIGIILEGDAPSMAPAR
jgi:septal ring factor EnvC (AmiA/AmiB activator)